MHLLTFDECSLVDAIYTDDSLYKKIGQTFCIAFDIVFGKGGPEAVVESVYSTMNNQKQFGGQSDQTLVHRTKVDWHCPVSTLSIDDFVDEVTQLYHQTHVAPYTFGNLDMSKVCKRLKGDTGKLPPKI